MPAHADRRGSLTAVTPVVDRPDRHVEHLGQVCHRQQLCWHLLARYYSHSHLLLSFVSRCPSSLQLLTADLPPLSCPRRRRRRHPRLAVAEIAPARVAP